MNDRTKEYESVAYQLFHKSFLVSIPQIYFHTEESLRIFGTPTQPNSAATRAMLNTPENRYMSAAAMAMFLDEGAPIQLQNPKDAEEIYRLSSKHIANWYWIGNNIPSAILPPPEDFMLLQALSDAVKPLHDAIVASDKTQAKPGLFSRLSTLRGRSRPMAAPRFRTHAETPEDITEDIRVQGETMAAAMVKNAARASRQTSNRARTPKRRG